MKETQKGMLLVLSGASGTGKGTLLEKLLKDDPTFGFSVSVTTREMRSNEIADVHYHFLSEEEYDKLLEEDAFLEHATVHGKRYGTLKSEAEKVISEGRDVILEIEVEGALQVKRLLPDDTVAVTIVVNDDNSRTLTMTLP